MNKNIMSAEERKEQAKTISKYLSAIGRKGGASRSERKAAASRENGKKGGARKGRAEIKIAGQGVEHLYVDGSHVATIARADDGSGRWTLYPVTFVNGHEEAVDDRRVEFTRQHNQHDAAELAVKALAKGKE